jgi:hypothetical protein
MPACRKLGVRFMMTTMISRFCTGTILTLAMVLAQDVLFFREYGAGPEQPSELATDGTAFYVVGGILPSYSAIPGVATPETTLTGTRYAGSGLCARRRGAGTSATLTNSSPNWLSNSVVMLRGIRATGRQTIG